MITRFFSIPARHEHAEPAQRVLGAAELAPDSIELARLLAADPEPDVRIAAAQRCTILAALAAAWDNESDPAVRIAIACALGRALGETQDSAAARLLLESDRCTDAIRFEVARRTQDAERRQAAIAGIRDEAPLIELALAAELAETRLAAADRVQTPAGLRRLADEAKNKDHGVARLVRQRIDALNNRRDQEDQADAILGQLEALANEPGAILTAVVELDRRWQRLDMSGDAGRLERHDAARRIIQARFDREQDEQRSRARFERKLREWIGGLSQPAAPDALGGLRSELALLREEAQARGDGGALSELDRAEQRIARWEEEHLALAAAEALVLEAENLAAGAAIDSALLLARWQALDRAIRTPALSRRFESALMQIEQRRLAQDQARAQQLTAARQQLHGLLFTAERSLAAGQLRAARAAADEIKTIKTGLGSLPKPTTQRLSRLVQQLVELERWESFGQQNARVQLCERAESLGLQTLEAAKLALEVQKLRNEWKALDQQHAGVPKALWERFDGACEKAYAPAAKHFAELAAQRKQARKRREEFIAAAEAHVPTLLGEAPDWRAVERWLRETERVWREGDLGSVDPATWRKLDLRVKSALTPLREALSATRDQAKSSRQSLIDEATALAPKAMERDTPSQIKALQSKWQEQAKSLPLAQRDERVLWERFRAACNAVFDARQDKRKEEDGRRQEYRRGLEELCAQIEQLALASDKDEQDIRRALRDLQEQWKKLVPETDPALRSVEARFAKAKSTVNSMLSARARSREAAVWQTLAAKERLCEQLDGSVISGASTAESAAQLQAQWDALPKLPSAWEQKLIARRDAALGALTDAAAASAYRARIEQGADSRRESLLELELLLGLESPSELQSQRLALQVKQLRARFKSAATTSPQTPGDRLLTWCAHSGVVDARDRSRCDQIFSKIEQTS
ncbi:MAG: DUF349 domain-containing protein [Betaproteobacteria bacterium]|nr:DUF349 domain-containing protein [Betaproteobacteria bacterium]